MQCKSLTLNNSVMQNLFNWEVEEHQIQTTAGVELPQFKVLMRSDTNEPIVVKNDSYETLHNWQIQQVAEAIVKEKGITNAKAMTCRKGKSVITQLELPEDFAIANDKVVEFVTLINSHDGLTGFNIGFGNMVLSCQNQFHQFRKASQFKISHTKSMYARIEQALDKIEKIQVHRKRLNDYLLEFGNTVIDTEEFVKKFVERIWKFDIGLDPETAKKEFGISTRIYNTANACAADIYDESKRKGETLWGAFNGVTYFTNHTQRAKDRTNHLVFGTGNRLNQEALNMGIKVLN